MARLVTWLPERAFLAGAAPAAGPPEFSDDSRWARERACDARRFKGPGIASPLSRNDTDRDASDWERLFERGAVRLITGP